MIHYITAVFRPLLSAVTSRFVILFALSFFALIAFVMSNTNAVSYAAVEEKIYLPIIIKPVPPSPPRDPVIENNSFEDGWTDLPPAPGYLINQQPNGWQLTWVEQGENIFGSDYVAQGIPECVHKLEDQLPIHERPGGSDPLILDGTSTYKIFHFAAAFGAELEQVVTDLIPGQAYRITVPLRIHGVDSDPWGAESGAWVDGVGGWVNQSVMGDRTWYVHTLDFTALPSGEAVVTIRVKSKYNLSKDFFIDNVQIEAVSPEGG
jgi:hypothetical protein